MRYEVDSARVAQGSDAVQTAAVQITAEVDRMMHCLTELQSCWTGRAAVSFQRVVGEWRTTQAQVRASLDDIQKALAAAGRQYQEVEDAAVRLFTR